MSSRGSRRPVAVITSIGLREHAAPGSPALAVSLDQRGIHERSLVTHTGSDVNLALNHRKLEAKIDVESTGEESLFERRLGMVVCLAPAAVRLAATGRQAQTSVAAGAGGITLHITIGGCDYHLEVVLVLAHVGCGGAVHATGEDAALVVVRGGWVGTGALVWVPARVALDEDVETGAEIGGIAVGGTCRGVVARQGLVSEVRVSRHGAL